MATVKFNYKIDGWFDSVNYYRSETPMDVNALPIPTQTGISGLSYSDTTAEDGKNYYVRFSSINAGVERVSEEINFTTEILWTPNYMTTPKFTYLDGDSLAITDGGIGTWLDLSGNSNNFTNSMTTATMPTVSTINGKQTALFDGVGNYLTNNNLNLFRNTGDGWCFITYKRISAMSTAGNVLSHNCRTANSTNLRFGFGLVFGSARTDGGSIVNTPSNARTDNTWSMSLFVAKWSSGRHYDYKDGNPAVLSPTFAVGNTSDTDSANGTTIGRFRPSDTSNKSSCEIACVVMGSGSSPTQDEIDKLMGWSAHKYGLVNNLPIDHPYKNKPPVV